MTNLFRNRTRQSSENKVTRSRSRKQTGQIVEGKLLPFRVLNCIEGNRTFQGKGMLHFELQHLESHEIIQSTVFENEAPEYIDAQIYNAIIPTDIENFDLEDLINGGFFASLEFNRKNGKTYMNIVHVEPLDDHFKVALEEFIAEKQEQQRKTRTKSKSFEVETDSLIEDDENELDTNECNIVLDDIDLDENDINIYDDDGIDLDLEQDEEEL